MEINRLNKLMSFKYMIALTIPIFIELLLQLVVGYSDQIMMSMYPNAVNGITNANVIINMVITVFSVLSTAAIILITQYRGLKDEKREKNVYATTFWFNFLASLVFSLLMLGLSRYYLRWIQTPEKAYNDALIYTIICGGLLFFQTMSTTLSALLKSNNLMKESMIINTFVNILNIVGNFLFIYLFAKIDLPIVGVALSSTISRFIGFILMYIVYKKKIGVSLSFKCFLSEKATLKMLIKVGGPSGGEAVSYNSSQIIIQLVINQIVNSNGGDVGIGNIKTYASMFAMLTYMFTSAVSQAMQVIIGELLGAGKIEQTNKKVWQTVLISSLASTCIALIFFFTSDYLFAIFKVTDPSLLRIGKMVMLIEIALELGRAFNIVFVRALQTSGDVMFPTITAVIFCWSVAVFGSFILGSPYFIFKLGIIGIWIAMTIDECIRAIIFIFRWRHGKWKTLNLASQ